MIPVLIPLMFFTIVGDVRQAATAGDFAAGEKLVSEYRKAQGNSPESVEAYSWLARGALAAKKFDQAVRYADETEKQVLARVNAATLDTESHLPIALGAAIEVKAQALAAVEGRSSGIVYLKAELAKYAKTSIRTRVLKNINLLSLEGQNAPKIEGLALPAKPILLFFWAHWCSDCKATAPVLAELQKAFPQLVVIGPTRLYGYAEGGREVSAAEEKTYIGAVRQKFYSEVKSMPTLISDTTFTTYGASTTPTLVLVDRKGIVRLYHPGRMTLDELRPHVRKLVSE